MSHDLTDTLLFTIERSAPPRRPESDADGTLVLFPPPDFVQRASRLFPGNLTAMHPEYAVFQSLQMSGVDVHADEKAVKEGAPYASAVVYMPRQKQAAYYAMALAIQAAAPGGQVYGLASNDAGAKGMEKIFKTFGLFPRSESKHKARCTWAEKDIDHVDKEAITQAIDAGSVQENAAGLYSRPGLFGWEGIDKGSEILVQVLPETPGPRGADLGCGYGYLTCQVLNTSSGVKEFYAADHDFRAVGCCELNVQQKTSYRYHFETSWCDISKACHVPDDLDFVVMNPPFHTGKTGVIALGQAFIHQAAACLKKRGRLYMVANRHLPYESVLDAAFKTTTLLDDRDGYKVFEAVK